jgi:SAM-dependent methyltransferase
MLDVGCSTGYDVAYFNRHGIRTDGCDITPSAIKKAKSSFPEYSFFVHNFESSPVSREYKTIYASRLLSTYSTTGRGWRTSAKALHPVAGLY